MAKHFSVAIDGPSGAGKSTLARAAAERFGFVYADTGAIYRTLGLAVRRAGVEVNDVAGIMELLSGLDIRLVHDKDGVQRMYLNGEDVSSLIRTQEISSMASAVSAIPQVRAFLMDMQRDIARSSDVVMDGRDIGTVVLPEADLKVFLTASAETRAERRCAQLRAKGERAVFSEVLAQQIRRDEDDATRAAAPLIAAVDAVTLDTGDMKLNESIDAICDLISTRRGSI